LPSQLEWLQNIGFVNEDNYWKCLYCDGRSTTVITFWDSNRKSI
jgi:hypothetical protein